MLVLSQGTVDRITAGHIFNLASNDVHRFEEVTRPTVETI